MKNNINKPDLKVVVLTGLLIPFSASAVQPLSEQAMDDVSFESGLNILNVYGPTSAGLSDDIDPLTTSAEDKEKQLITATTSAKELLEDAEGFQNESTTAQPIDTNLSFKEVEEAISAGISTVGRADTTFDTSSEIQYNKKSFIHDAEFLSNGDVIHTRDLQIDLLKVEDIKGNYRDEGRTIGDIYLSNWESRGSATLSVE